MAALMRTPRNPGRAESHQYLRLLVITAASISLVVAVEHWIQPRSGARTEEQADVEACAAQAEIRHAQAAEVLLRAKREAGIVPPPGIPASYHGFVGRELSPLVTTLGSLDAKILAASPRWASAMTRQLAEDGVGRGDVVTASFSGSFPGLNVALIAACQALGADLVAVSSVTASTWGATEPGFTWPETEVLLVAEGVIPPVSRAISVGGSSDRGADLSPSGLVLAHDIQQATSSALQAMSLRPRSLKDAIAARMEVLDRASNNRQPSLFASVGGNHASLGGTPAILRLRSGFIPAQRFDSSDRRGMVARYAERGVPSLLLLNVRDLAAQWDIESR